jgi:ribosomal small subunit protein bTHX
MGKGDKRTRRGKIFAGSFGKTRPKGKKNVNTNTNFLHDHLYGRDDRHNSI